jgi:periplasmic divalent cation tolerance protein
MSIFYLTCADDFEADKISRILLEKKLIVCAKKSTVSSSFLWKGKIENSREVLLMMDSIAENFEKINSEIKKIHSYETYNLSSIKVDKTTKEVEDWIKKEIIS